MKASLVPSENFLILHMFFSPRRIFASPTPPGAASVRSRARQSLDFRMKTTVIAIGGNSLIKDARHTSVPDQYGTVVETARHITDPLDASLCLKRKEIKRRTC